MRSSLFSASSLRLAALALTFGLAGVAQAADTPDLSAKTPAMQDSQRVASGDAGSRIDWNVDYPSQLGPEGPQAANARAARPTAAAETPNRIATAQQPSSI